MFLLAGAAAAWAMARSVHVDVAPATGEGSPPRNADWQAITLPDSRQGPAWYRITFEAPPERESSWAVYLPYLYGGGTLWLNGEPLAQVQQSGAGLQVRWERPFLFPVPDAMLRAGSNTLLVLVAADKVAPRARMPALKIGSHAKLVADYDRRAFWVRTMPQFTVVACLVTGLLMSLIWWYRREEMLYGLFGLASLLWGGRTLTFIIETLPASAWPVWRLFYHSATGGFIVVLTLFSMRLAGYSRPWVDRALLAYWLLGPLGYVVTGGAETLIGQVWAGGLIPIGIAMVVMSLAAAVRQRTWAMAALSAAISLAVLTGVNDFLLVSGSRVLPGWLGHRIFLLHYGADLLLLVMGAILSARFVEALQAVEHLNRTLEQRVQQRERALADNYAQLGRLSRERAADEERQRIMRDLHDGLGSQLFVTLSRVEVRQIDYDGICEALRHCIADMRLALDAMSPEGNDFLEAWSNFRHRWEGQLETAGLLCSWEVQVPGGVLELPPHAGLQLLRVAQEALTNVLKHAGARRVSVLLQADAGCICLEVKDDGRGLPTGDVATMGRGLANMALRAARLDGRLECEPARPGTLVRLRFARAIPATGSKTLELEHAT